MSNISRYAFGDIVEYITNPTNPDLNNRSGYLLFIKAEVDGFYAIKGYKMRNMSDEQKEKIEQLGLLLGEENSDLHVDTFFDYNYMVKYSYDFINGYRWTLNEKLKNEAVQGIIKADNDKMYPDTFKINSFLETIKYSETTQNIETKNVAMVSPIQSGIIEQSNGISRKRTNVVNKK